MAMAMVISMVVALAFSPAVWASSLVKKFSGTRSTTTMEFEVESPWVLDWRVNGDYPSMLGIDVSLIQAGTGAYSGYVLKTKYPGNGVRLIRESGRFQLQVSSSMANWTFKILQLTEEEAALYTPKN